MLSPYPPFAEAILKWQPLTDQFKGEEFDIIEYFWHDPVTGNSFDNVETAQATIMQIYNAYRIRHGLPFIDELTELRQFVNLPSDQMSLILGLDQDKYQKFEKGTMPTDVEGEYIKSLINNKLALKDCVEKHKSILTEEEYQYAIQAFEGQREDETMSKLLPSRDKNNGYAPNVAKRTRNIILYLLSQFGPVSPAFLNTILFYTDFYAYRKRGMALSGFSYEALPTGPAPTTRENIPLLDGVEQQEKDNGKVLLAVVLADIYSLSEEELSILDDIIIRFKGLTDSQLINFSQQEEAWIKSRSAVNTTISFDHAFSLKAI